MTSPLDPDTLSRQILVRHREAGHLRFALPAGLCAAAAAEAIEAALHRQDGVYRVTVYRRARKLSVFYDEHVCGVQEIARRLVSALVELPAGEPPSGAAAGEELGRAAPR